MVGNESPRIRVSKADVQVLGTDAAESGTEAIECRPSRSGGEEAAVGRLALISRRDGGGVDGCGDGGGGTEQGTGKRSTERRHRHVRKVDASLAHVGRTSTTAENTSNAVLHPQDVHGQSSSQGSCWYP
jgi:hypothetical protein